MRTTTAATSRTRTSWRIALLNANLQLMRPEVNPPSHSVMICIQSSPFWNGYVLVHWLIQLLWLTHSSVKEHSRYISSKQIKWSLPRICGCKSQHPTCPHGRPLAHPWSACFVSSWPREPCSILNTSTFEARHYDPGVGLLSSLIHWLNLRWNPTKADFWTTINVNVYCWHKFCYFWGPKCMFEV